MAGLTTMPALVATAEIPLAESVAVAVRVYVPGAGVQLAVALVAEIEVFGRVVVVCVVVSVRVAWNRYDTVAPVPFVNVAVSGMVQVETLPVCAIVSAVPTVNDTPAVLVNAGE
jgi:hypothetical protein